MGRHTSPNHILNSLPKIVIDVNGCPTIAQLKPTIVTLKVVLDMHTGYLFSQESASYVILGVLCVHFSSELHRKFGVDYMYINQYQVANNLKQGQNPRSDSCVVLVDRQFTPRFLYECKTRTAPTILQLDDKDVVEVLLQGYYCLKHYETKKMLISLTDLLHWHYFQIEESNQKMKVTGCKYITMALDEENMYSESDLVEHTQFVIQMERHLKA